LTRWPGTYGNKGGLDIYTDPEDPPGHLVVRDGEYTRTFTPEEVVALATALLAMGLMDERGRPLKRRISVGRLDLALRR